MATPTSHPRPSPQKPAPNSSRSHLTPPPATSPKPLTPSKRGFHQANLSHSRHPSASTNTHVNGQAMSRTTSTQSHKPQASPPSHRPQPLARTNTASSFLSPGVSAANTPTPARTVTSGGESPAASAAVGILMQELKGGTGMTPTASGIAALAGGHHGGLNDLAGLGHGSQGGLATHTGLAGLGGASLAGLAGMTASQAEEERKRRISIITSLLSSRWGYVSPEGVTEAAKRLGLELDQEEDDAKTPSLNPSAPKQKKVRKDWFTVESKERKELSVAGDGFMVEMMFVGDAIESVRLTSHGTMRWEEEWTTAADVLRDNLRVREEEGEGYRDLGDLVGNLEALKRLDKAGGAGVNCFDAVAGVKKGLEVLWAREVEDEKAKGKKGRAALDAVMCERGGRPAVHEREKVGLSVQFWKDQHLVSDDPDDGDAMDIDTPSPEPTSDDRKIYSLAIECETHPSDQYPPVRISDHWIAEHDSSSQSAENQLPITNTNLIWLDPPSDLPDPPNARFIAKLSPPLIVPLPIALQLHGSLSAPLPPDTILPMTFESLLLANVDGINALQGGPRVFSKTVNSYAADATPSSHTHKTTLFLNSQDMSNHHGIARTITEVPFSHPKQVVDMLPVLRQWTLVASILRRSFTDDEPIDTVDASAATTSPEFQSVEVNGTADKGVVGEEQRHFQSLEDELADFLASPLPSSANSLANNGVGGSDEAGGPVGGLGKVGELGGSGERKEGGLKEVKDITISFTTSPLPHFALQFPHPKHRGLVQVAFSVGMGGRVEGVDLDLGDGDVGMGEGGEGGGEGGNSAEKRRAELKEKVKRVIEVSEDLGVLVEWVCGFLGKG